MDNQSSNPQRKKLYIMYHDPCMDGIFSLMSLMMPLITKIRKEGWTIQKYREFLIAYLEKLKIEENKPKEFVETQKQFQYEDHDMHPNNAGFFYPQFEDLVFLPIKLSEFKNEVIKMIQYKTDNRSISTIILVDYFGRDLDGIQFLSKEFQYVVIIDHHQTCLNEINKLEKYAENPQKFTRLNHLENNLFFHMDIEKAACQLAVEYNEQLFGEPYMQLVPKNIGEKILFFNKYIADNDLFLLNYKETEPLQMAIMKERYVQDVRANQVIFFQLLKLDFDFMVKRGISLTEERHQKVMRVVHKRKTICFDKNARGYAIYSEDMVILNPLGKKLALLSLKAGDHNIGVIYYEDKKNDKQYKCHLRSAKKDENGNELTEFRCDLLAERFGGGGHIGASTMYMSKVALKKFMFE